MSRTSKMFLSALCLLLLVVSLAGAQETAAITRGERIFNAYCTGCHAISAEVVFGPGLKGVTERRSVDWLKGFIHNPALMLRKKDATAVELVAKFNGYVMPTLGLTERNVADVVSYLRSKAR